MTSEARQPAGGGPEGEGSEAMTNTRLEGAKVNGMIVMDKRQGFANR